MKFFLSFLNLWRGCRDCLWKSKKEYLRAACSQRNSRDPLHVGHGNLPCTHQPTNSAYAGKSCVEYMYQTRIMKFFFLKSPYVLNPLSQASCNSSLSGCMYTFIFFPGHSSSGMKPCNITGIF